MKARFKHGIYCIINWMWCIVVQSSFLVYWIFDRYIYINISQTSGYLWYRLTMKAMTYLMSRFLSLQNLLTLFFIFIISTKSFVCLKLLLCNGAYCDNPINYCVTPMALNKKKNVLCFICWMSHVGMTQSTTSTLRYHLEYCH